MVAGVYIPLTIALIVLSGTNVKGQNIFVVVYSCADRVHSSNTVYTYSIYLLQRST